MSLLPLSDFPRKPQITLSWEFITPDRARELMERNLERNRTLRKLWVSSLAAAIRSGEFLPTHQGIALDENHDMIDGQHRLQAIIEADIGCWLLVARNVPKNAVVAMDLHARRAPHDQIKIMSDNLDFIPDNKDVAIARMMKSGGAKNGDARIDPETSLLTTNQIHHFLINHWQAIRFSRQFYATAPNSAPIRAAVARAYYYMDREKLSRFMQVLATQLADNPSEHAAVNFRKWCDDLKNAHIVQGGRTSRADLYMITISAIHAFFKGQTGRSFKAAEIDPWPLPE
jgi:ribosomal protein L20